MWISLVGAIAFLLPTFLINLWLKKRLEAVFLGVQEMVEERQNQLRRKMTQLQNKMVSGGRGLQRRLEKEQADGIREALKELEKVKYNPIEIATIEFDKGLLPITVKRPLPEKKEE